MKRRGRFAMPGRRSDTASNTIIAGNGAGKEIVHGVCKRVNDALVVTKV